MIDGILRVEVLISLKVRALFKKEKMKGISETQGCHRII